MPSVDYYNDEGAAIITLTNSKEGNRLNLTVLQELSNALGSALADGSVRVVVLRSDGGTFCLGMDFSALRSGTSRARQVEESVSLYAGILHTIYTARTPVIALLQGPVKAGGVGLVASADIVAATEEASFQLSEVLFGLLPANVLPYLLGLRLTPQKSRYVVLTAKEVGAGEAHTLGLIDELCTVERFEKEVKKLIKGIFRSSPTALAKTKRFTSRLTGFDLDRRRKEAKAELLELLGNRDVIEAVRSFEDGEVPDWFSSFKPKRPLTTHTKEE